MKFLEFIRKVMMRLFPSRSSVEERTKLSVAISSTMENAIELWTDLYEDKPPWMRPNFHTLGLPAAIAEEFARLVTLEMKSSVSGDGDGATWLDAQYQPVIRSIRNQVEFAAAKGGIAMKPYLTEDGNLDVDYTTADRFFPTAYNSSGEITAAIFVDFKTIGKVRFTKMESHTLNGTTYTVKNLCFRYNNYANSDSMQDLGYECPLSDVPEWAGLAPDVKIENVQHPLFSYFKMPKANNLDSSSPLGCSVYSRATDIIHQADIQYNRILWEYESTESAIDANVSLFGKDKKGNPKLPVGKERLYRTYKFERRDAAIGDLISKYGPDIRDSSLFHGLDQLLKRIEFNCQLSYGTLSDPQSVEKTAEEIKMSKQRSFSAVSDMQTALQTALERLVYAMDVLRHLYSLAPDCKYGVGFDWDDSIITDRDKQFQQQLQLANGGFISKIQVVMWYYGVDEKKALELMPTADNEADPFDTTPE